MKGSQSDRIGPTWARSLESSWSIAFENKFKGKMVEAMEVVKMFMGKWA
jgi:hypothetical protein